jgi:hypothetical protein
MEELKTSISHIELDLTSPHKLGVDQGDVELQQALKNYVPGSDTEKKFLRKIDLRLMPILWVMYILNYVDRTNIVRLPFRPNQDGN